MNLPTSNNLPINKLASVFGSTSATYKFYWLIALIELVEEENKYDEKHAKEKYLYAVLKWVYKNQSTFSEPLEAVECIYADFDYPEIISKFVRYASNNEPDLGSRELNIKRIYNNWEKYLETEKIKWKKEMNIKF